MELENLNLIEIEIFIECKVFIFWKTFIFNCQICWILKGHSQNVPPVISLEKHGHNITLFQQPECLFMQANIYSQML